MLKAILPVIGLSLLVAVPAAAQQSKPSYVRLGAGLSDSNSAVYRDRDCASTDPAALFGCADGPDGNPIGAYGGYGSSVIIEGAWGHYLSDWLRGELAFGYRPDLDFTGQSNFAGVTLGTEPVEARGRNVTMMANAYLMLTPLFGNIAGFQPFISGGAGLAFNRTSEVSYFFPSLGAGDATITQPGSTTDFAWSLGAGAVVDLGDTIAVELAYRYFDMGKMRTRPGDIQIIREGRDDLMIPVDATHASLDAHEFLFSLIYRY
ncbi:MAG: outer membrane protein [Alphaproteobacteria bacterium]